VNVRYTCQHPNGTMLDAKYATSPLEFQLGCGDIVAGLEKGVASMRVGERAELSCTPRWVHGLTTVDKRVPLDAPLHYNVELISCREGPPLEDNEDFDIHTYKSSLQGQMAAQGRTHDYTWSEGGEEVTLRLPLQGQERAKDISCVFGRNTLSITVGSGSPPRVQGELRGSAATEDCYWVIDDDDEHGRHLQVVIGKAGAFSCWDGVLVGEQIVPP